MRKHNFAGQMRPELQQHRPKFNSCTLLKVALYSGCLRQKCGHLTHTTEKIIPVEFGDRLEMDSNGFRIGNEDVLFWLCAAKGV